MEEKIAFDNFLFGDGNEIVINDIEYCVDRIIKFPKVRPHQLEKAVSLSVEYCKIADFKRKLFIKSNQCPVLIYKLYKRGVFELGEIKQYLVNREAFLLCFYFRKEIDDFEKFIKNKRKPHELAKFHFENSNDIDQQIEYGFIPSSIEYCLKYDVIDDIVSFNNFDQKAKWSPFEWSNEPNYLDLFSFCGFFGSIKCFKHLLMKECRINDHVLSNVVCSGCLDLFHLCKVPNFYTFECICKTSEYCHISLLVFMRENGANLDAKDTNVGFLDLI